MTHFTAGRKMLSGLALFTSFATCSIALAAVPMAAPALSLQPMAQAPHLGTPLRVRLQAGQFAIKSVTVLQKSDSWHASSQPAVLHTAPGWDTIEIVPMQLGEVHVAVLATLSNGMTAERRMTFQVSLPEEAPVAFHATSKDLLLMEKGGTQTMVPTARFAGMTQDVPIDPALVTFKVVHDDFDDNPAIEVNTQGQVHANGRASMLVEATFMGKTSTCRVKVLPKLD